MAHPPPPGAYPPPYPQQPQQNYPGGYPQRDPNSLPRIMGTVIIIVGYVSAGLGTLGSFFVFGIKYGDTGLSGADEFYQFLSTLSTSLGVGAIAVAAGFLLKLRVASASQT